METIIIIMLVGVLNLLAFFMGAKICQNVKKDENISIPSLTPSTIKEKFEEKVANDKRSKQEAIMKRNFENIDEFDGTSNGQKDFNDLL